MLTQITTTIKDKNIAIENKTFLNNKLYHKLLTIKIKYQTLFINYSPINLDKHHNIMPSYKL